ncbi:probable inactive histone-lysine N-methyltransferase SUVR2 isoform X2 [Tripterygium wilfordii]|uniref:probable inactive histone-lysine N-methyltransferase SUVR2 isoform X2 n=1 Tax=Tripterygium wilfordii TaxID=458696 RepID=UPI0018F83406|nr:probable inactive histone-lysine N-methyltransferase SUVR2 isoform X2 [Tripterygium wilfordii]
MAPNPRVSNAFRAMKAIGITEDKVKPVLKRLLKLYDKNWELIEEENYRVLADAIFDEDDTKGCEKKPNGGDGVDNFNEESEMHDEPRPLKRLRLRGREGQTSSSSNNIDTSLSSLGGSFLKIPKEEQDAASPSSLQHQNIGKQPLSPAALMVDHRADLSPPRATGPRSISSPSKRPEPDLRQPQVRVGAKGKEPLSCQVAPTEKRVSNTAVYVSKKRKAHIVEPGILLLPKPKVPGTHALLKPKDEPFTDVLPQYEVPIAVIHPDSSGKEDSSGQVVSGQKPDGQGPPASESVARENGGNDDSTPSNETITPCELATVSAESPSKLEIASSSMGEVKISLSCDSFLERPDFHMPSIDELLQSLEEKCLRSYKIIDPNFSVMNLMKDMCETFLELATDRSNESQERVMNITPAIDILKRSTARDALDIGAKEYNNCVPAANTSNGMIDEQGSAEAVHSCSGTAGERELRESEAVDSCSLVVVQQHQLMPDDLRLLHDVNDISKGEERVEIPWINEISNSCPPSFHYISQNQIFQNAHVIISLSGIGDKDCCPTCYGDCLSSSISCGCSHDTGLDFAYSSDGLIKEEFLEEYISIARDPQQQNLSFCQDCPLEKLKNDDILEPCKGHLKRRYIKECWSKCGCHKLCGNRVVQRRISCKLQVFFTPEGKGWGLRTLQKLPKGAFVCEYVGEILTNRELYERNIQGRHAEKLTHTVPLDAYWYLKHDLKEEEALCLDASFYGNVARCLDANLIEIPVEIETPEHHYYHLALFTTREVDALEELTWDYGVDFDDNGLPGKLFQCQCGSKFCRNIKRSSRSKSLSNAK